jgi:hypothetical protein
MTLWARRLIALLVGGIGGCKPASPAEPRAPIDAATPHHSVTQDANVDHYPIDPAEWAQGRAFGYELGRVCPSISIRDCTKSTEKVESDTYDCAVPLNAYYAASRFSGAPPKLLVQIGAGRVVALGFLIAPPDPRSFRSALTDLGASINARAADGGALSPGGNGLPMGWVLTSPHATLLVSVYTSSPETFSIDIVPSIAGDKVELPATPARDGGLCNP